jgi:hypothetical protein
MTGTLFSFSVVFIPFRGKDERPMEIERSRDLEKEREIQRKWLEVSFFSLVIREHEVSFTSWKKVRGRVKRGGRAAARATGKERITHQL